MNESFLPTSDALVHLATKYRTLASLRHEKLAGLPEPDRAIFRTLAAQFPGALRELDVLALDTILQRAAQLERAAHDGNTVSWMLWLHEYHLLMRTALVVRACLYRVRDPQPDLIATVCRSVLERTGLVISSSFVRGVADPPRGRMNEFVFADIAQRHGVTRDDVATTLFPNMCRTARPDA